MVANEPELLPFPHPSQPHLHMPFARESSNSNFLKRLELERDRKIKQFACTLTELDAFPSFSNIVRGPCCQK